MVRTMVEATPHKVLSAAGGHFVRPFRQMVRRLVRALAVVNFGILAALVILESQFAHYQ